MQSALSCVIALIFQNVFIFIISFYPFNVWYGRVDMFTIFAILQITNWGSDSWSDLIKFTQSPPSLFKLKSKIKTILESLSLHLILKSGEDSISSTFKIFLNPFSLPHVYFWLFYPPYFYIIIISIPSSLTWTTVKPFWLFSLLLPLPPTVHPQKQKVDF